MTNNLAHCHCEEGALPKALSEVERVPTKQSRHRGGRFKTGLLRRFAPRNDRFRLLFLVFAAAILVSCSSGRGRLAYTDSASPDWLTPRANAANTGYVDAGLMTTRYKVLWTVKTGGIAATEPIVRDGLLFHCGFDRRLEIYDLATGERRFRKRFDGPVTGVIPGDSTFGVLVDQSERRYITFDLRTAKARSNFRIPYASAPPRRLSDSTILFVTWQGHVLCLASDGDTIWDADCDGAIKSAPAIRDSTIYVSAGHSIFALGAKDGAKAWRYRAGAAIEAAPAIDDRLYFGATDSAVCALDLGSGSVVWTAAVTGRVFTTPTIGEDLIFVASNDGLITALEKADGRSRWTYNTGVVANLAPTLAGDYLLVTSRQPIVTMLDASTGEPIWSDSLLAAQATIPPLVVGDRIILADARRNLVCLVPTAETVITSGE